MPRVFRTGTALLLGMAILLGAAACRDGGPEPAGAELAERWLRLGEDVGTGVVVYERTLPPMLVDLLNPHATEEAPEEDLVRLPVHPSGALLGSYMLRRPDASTLLWLFYDVPAAQMSTVTADVALQLDESPWQVVGQQGNRAYTVVQFQSTRGDDLTGTAIVESAASTDRYELVVDRDGSHVRLEVERAAARPMLEVELAEDLTVRSTQPGLAREAGLQQDDRILSVSGTEVATREDLDAAMIALGAGEGPVTLTYLLQVAPPGTASAPPYRPHEGLLLPEDFPLRDALDGLIVDQYQTFLEPTGNFFGASLLSEESTSVVSARLRDALEADDWEILADQPMGFATTLEFVDAAGGLVGSMQIDVFPEDESFTQVILQIQTDRSGG